MSDQELLDLCELILGEEDELLIPIEKLLELILQEKEDIELDFKKLKDLLVKDTDHFRVIDSPVNDQDWDENNQTLLKNFGFYHGPRVLLRSKSPNEEELLREIANQIRRALETINSVYNNRRDGISDEEEIQILEIMKRLRADADASSEASEGI
jgi:hypothetical protein